MNALSLTGLHSALMKKKSSDNKRTKKEL